MSKHLTDKQRERLGVYGLQDLMYATLAEDSENYIVGGLLSAGSINLLVGDSGLGKTPLCVQLALSVATGIPFLGLPTKQGSVLYCDAESGRDQFTRMTLRVMECLGNKGLPAAFEVWSPIWESPDIPDEMIADNREKLFNRVKAMSPSLVIVDTHRAFFPSAEGKAESSAALINQMRKLSKSTKTTWLTIHHRRKADRVVGTPDIATEPYLWMQETAGSQALVNGVDTRIGVDVARSGRADIVLAGLVRISGEIPVFPLIRVTADDDEPMGYDILRGVDALSPKELAAWNTLNEQFTHKDANEAMGGKSKSKTTNFLKRAALAQLVRKRDKYYVKVDHPA